MHRLERYAGSQGSVDTPSRWPFFRLERLRDEELVEHLKNGDDDALAVLCDRYRRLVLSIALKILRDAGEAEDLVQTVFFDIYRALGQFNGEKGSAKVWILQYAYNRSLNRRRYLKIRGFYDGRETSAPEGLDMPSCPARLAGLSVQESVFLVREALRTLSSVQRTILELAFFEGLSMAEIADRTSEAVVNVRQHYYRAIKKLRNLLCSEPPADRKVVRPSQADTEETNVQA